MSVFIPSHSFSKGDFPQFHTLCWEKSPNQIHPHIWYIYIIPLSVFAAYIVLCWDDALLTCALSTAASAVGTSVTPSLSVASRASRPSTGLGAIRSSSRAARAASRQRRSEVQKCCIGTWATGVWATRGHWTGVTPPLYSRCLTQTKSTCAALLI